MEHSSLKTWADDDKPRERLLKQGAATLTNAELLAILLRTGTRNETVVDLARRILASVHNNLDELGQLTVAQLNHDFKGIGQTKAITLMAALELGRRRKAAQAIERQHITSPADIAAFFQPILADLPHEEFWLMTLNRQNKLLGTHRISTGGVTATVADPKLIMRKAIEQLACGIAVCHNHPSGQTQPSADDIRLTNKLRTICETLDMAFIDHIIIAHDKYYSFASNNI